LAARGRLAVKARRASARTAWASRSLPNEVHNLAAAAYDSAVGTAWSMSAIAASAASGWPVV
jgi:hypothetical protein